MANNDNEDFQAELEALRGEPEVKTLVATQSEEDTDNAERTVSKAELFGDALAGKLPAIKQSFVVLKSREDKLVEMGRYAQEMFETRKVSRSMVVAFESIARELIPATEEEIASGERKVVVSDHEVNMYTEEPSAVEVDSTIVSSQENVDRIVSDLRASAHGLGKQLVETVQADQIERNEKITKSVSLFNQAICKFLIETNSKELTNSSVKFKRDLAWGNLMAIPLWQYAHLDSENQEKMVQSFDGTSGETFLKKLTDLSFSGALVQPVLVNFISGKLGIVRSACELRDDNDDKPFKHNYTVGELFHAFGTVHFSSFYNNLNDEIGTQVTAAKAAISILEGEVKLNILMDISNELQNQHKTIMDITANMAILNAVQYMIIEFLSTF